MRNSNKPPLQPMERQEYCDALIGRHEKMMGQIDRESPPLFLKAQLVSQDSVGDGFRAVFAVLNTSRAAKLASLVEQRVFMEHAASGVVLDAYDNKIVVSTRRKLPPGALDMSIHANYNNEILLKAAADFSKSTKEVHPCLLRADGEDGSSNGIASGCDALSPEGFFNLDLNPSQRKAIAFARKGAPFKILGPPGTGKTETIVEIISQCLGEGKSVIVCGPSNVSVDNIILRFTASKYNTLHNVPFYRHGSATKGLYHLNLEHRANEAVSFMDDQKVKRQDSRTGGNATRREIALYRSDRAERRKEFIKNLKSECSLVFSTLFSSLKESFYFDVCIVDEACQATELECFMGVVKARTFILAGDPNQLCPRFRSLYEAAELPIAVLNEQYRMPGAMIEFSNDYFYGGSIVSRRRDDLLFFDESSILLIDTSFFMYGESAHGTSKLNTEEALLIADVVKWIRGLERTGNARCTIGIITPYSAQVLLIRDTIDCPLGCTVDTVDGFQGQERDFIVLSLVRSSGELELGFLADKKRMNVALTRCRRGLVIIGDASNFRKNRFFQDFFAHVNKNACVLDPETFRQLVCAA